MTIQTMLMVLFYAVGLVAVLVVGKTKMKDATILAQGQLITALKDQNEQQALQIWQLQKRVRFLEQLLTGKEGADESAG